MLFVVTVQITCLFETGFANVAVVVSRVSVGQVVALQLRLEEKSLIAFVAIVCSHLVVDAVRCFVLLQAVGILHYLPALVALKTDVMIFRHVGVKVLSFHEPSVAADARTSEGLLLLGAL